MFAVVLKGHGGYEQLELCTDLPVPTPGYGEVLVRIAAAALNNTDINTRIAWYSRSPAASAPASPAAPAAPAAPAVPAVPAAPVAPQDSAWGGGAFQFPRIQGADACGYIVAVGAGVDTARIGERVLIDPILRGAGADGNGVEYFGADRDGAFAQFATVPSVSALAVVSELGDIELASFPCSYLAAENMVSRVALAPNQTVLITGASGGVGSAAVQLARRRGARVIAVAGAGKAAGLRALGAERVLAREADLVSQLGAGSVDAIIDSVGGAHFPQHLQILRRGGRYAVAGAVAGASVALDLRTLYLKDLTLFGCTIPEPGLFATLLGYIEAKEIRPLISATYPLREIVAAQQAFLEKKHLGKIVLVP